jgi:hypothetical protein
MDSNEIEEMQRRAQTRNATVRSMARVMLDEGLNSKRATIEGALAEAGYSWDEIHGQYTAALALARTLDVEG